MPHYSRPRIQTSKFRSLDSRSGVMGHFEFEGLAGRAYLTPTRDNRSFEHSTVQPLQNLNVQSLSARMLKCCNGGLLNVRSAYFEFSNPQMATRN